MKELEAVIQAAIAKGSIVGTNVVVAYKGKIVFEQQAGWADREEKQPVKEDTLFRLASMTKPIVSAAAMALVEKGLLKLDAPITHWLPSFKPKLSNGKDAYITVGHLLTHTAGFTYGFLFADNEPYRSAGVSDGMDESVLSLDENLERLAKVPLTFDPGTSWCYSLATDVLGAVLEKACGKQLPAIVEEYITKPLGMKDTSFNVKSVERLAKAYADGDKSGGSARLMQAKDKVLLEGCGPIHYAPGRITNAKAYPSGGSGMAGTARDYMTFLETIRRGGKPILQADSIKLMTQDKVDGFDVPAAGPGYGFGMGFAVVRDSEKAGTPRHAGSYEWGGVYGTKMFVDPANELSVVILTNTALHGLVGAFPADVTRAVYNDLGLKKKITAATAKSTEKEKNDTDKIKEKEFSKQDVNAVVRLSPVFEDPSSSIIKLNVSTGQSVGSNVLNRNTMI